MLSSSFISPSLVDCSAQKVSLLLPPKANSTFAFLQMRPVQQFRNGFPLSGKLLEPCVEENQSGDYSLFQ